LQQHFTKDTGQAQLEETLQQLRGEYFTKKTKVVSINRYLRYAMGAAAVLLIALFLFKPWQSLYDQYSEVEMNNPAERGDNTDSLLQQAYIAFNDKEYNEAANKLNEVRKIRPDDSFTNFYFALSLLYTGKILDAKQTFQSLYEGTSVYKYEAAFFMALCHLKENDKPAARTWLQKIPADATNYSKSQELLRKL
jgi:tetratricopeptide (TPR) repeat protein